MRKFCKFFIALLVLVVGIRCQNPDSKTIQSAPEVDSPTPKSPAGRNPDGSSGGGSNGGQNGGNPTKPGEPTVVVPEGEGHFVCSSSAQIIRSVRDRAEPQVFPATFYMADPVSDFPVRQIDLLNAIGYDEQHVDVIFAANQAATVKEVRYLYNARLNVNSRSSSVKVLSKLMDSDFEQNIARALEAEKAKLQLSAMIDVNRFLAPVLVEKKNVWAIWNKDSATPTLILSGLNYPDNFNPIISGNTVVFQTFEKDHFAKRIGTLSEKGFTENKETGAVPADAEQFHGGLVAGDINGSIWWFEKSTAKNKVVIYNPKDSSVLRLDIAQDDKTYYMGQGRLERVEGGYQLNLVSTDKVPKIFQLKGADTFKVNEVLEGPELASEDGGAEFAGVGFGARYLTMHFQTKSGRGVKFSGLKPD